uniref:Cyclin-dependent kinase like 6 n=1 Tax=Dimocarpus longan TaxID=128017 RepID=A0A8G0VTY7_9ROSI|nr:cyclin-dependent kinase like 6 [Dimocarpus longan]
MGCVQGKRFTNSPDSQLEKLKAKSGYVKGVSRGRVILMTNGGSSGPAGGSEKRVPGEAEKVKNSGGGAGGGSRRSSRKKIADDELVGGWPKWLVDNISGEVLAGLVPKSADSYDKLAKVGQGTYSNVYKARDRDTGKIVALKKVRFDTSEPASVRFMAREILVLQKLDHPNVIKLKGLATSRMQYSLYLVFDYMQTDLTRVICRPGQRLTQPQVKRYMQQLLAGLEHCHKRGILHRDIKASNLLIDKNGVLKIADFGLANFFIPKPKNGLTSRVVTLWYRAPELLLGSTDYEVGIDLWSAGCLLAEMFIGRPIMPGRTEVEQLHRIFKLCGSPSEDYWNKLKVTTTFRPTQLYKPSFQEAFEDFPPSSFGILTTLLALEPANRGTAASALQNEFFSSSPLPCKLSELPVMNKVEDESAETDKPKRRRSTKAKKYTHKNKGHRRKDSTAEQGKGNGESSKEMEKTQERMIMHGSNSASSSTSSTAKTISRHEDSLNVSLSLIRRSNTKRSPKTEVHPNALRNIQNYTLLQASISDIVNHRQGNAFAPYSRTLSTLDFRTLDPEKISKLFGLDKD